jgi:hypothetical protein
VLLFSRIGMYYLSIYPACPATTQLTVLLPLSSRPQQRKQHGQSVVTAVARTSSQRCIQAVNGAQRRSHVSRCGLNLR